LYFSNRNIPEMGDGLIADRGGDARRSFLRVSFHGPNFSVVCDTEICAMAHIPNELLHYDGAIFVRPKFAYSFFKVFFRVVANLVCKKVNT
jgi:hypothetical protein